MKELIEAKKFRVPLCLMTRKPRFFQLAEAPLATSSSRFGYANPKEHGFSQETLKIQVEPSIHKSRRIENTKRNVFNSKLNKILFAVIFLLILLVLAMKLL